MTEVNVVGDACVDMVFRPVSELPPRGGETVVDEFEVRAGGSAGYVASALAALGVTVAASTAVGEGPLSDFWLSTLDDSGVDIGSVRTESEVGVGTGVVLLDDTDRSFITYRGANSVLEPRLERTGSVLMVSGFSQTPTLWTQEFVEYVEKRSASGTTVTLDTNWSPGEWQSFADRLLPHVDYLLVNAEEAKGLAAASTPEAAARQLVDSGATSCVITLGEDGCLLATSDATETVPAPTTDPVDYNAAGDVFNAGLVSALSSGRSLPDACRFANRCAATAISTFSFEEKMRELGSLRP